MSGSFLELAMNELIDTAENGHRLIGIISHVEEVKGRIPRRIEVTKGTHGRKRGPNQVMKKKGKREWGDFQIENGCLKKYTGTDAEAVVPDGITRIGETAFDEC